MRAANQNTHPLNVRNLSAFWARLGTIGDTALMFLQKPVRRVIVSTFRGRANLEGHVSWLRANVALAGWAQFGCETMTEQDRDALRDVIGNQLNLVRDILQGKPLKRPVFQTENIS